MSRTEVEVDNGLLELVRATSLVRYGRDRKGSFDSTNRVQLTRIFSWAIPNAAALECITELARDHGVLEVGAGTGYWAALLQQMGADVIATDVAPPRPDRGAEHNVWHPATTCFVDVEQMDASEAASAAGRRTLLLCWPPSTSEMGFDAVSAYQGPVVVYVGEWAKGTTGTPALHRMLERDWVLDRTVTIPVWWRREDCVRVFRRKPHTGSDEQCPTAETAQIDPSV